MTDPELLNEQVLLARQPIYDSQLEIHAYELLFRPSKALVRDDDWDPDYATSRVLLHAFTSLDTRMVTGGKLAFVNFTRSLILDTPKLKTKDIIIEVLEDLTPDQELFEALRLLTKLGYGIALDDFVYDPAWDDIIGLAKYIKIDVLHLNHDQIREQVSLLKRFDVELLAEKVEDLKTFKLCKSLGFKYFQGYFLCHPECVRGKTLPTSRLAVLKLLGELQDPEIEISQLQKTVAHDPSLSAKLLKIFEASSYSHLPKIQSIQHAITLIGIIQLRNWANLLVLSKLDNKPHALLLTALNRAKFCEALAIKGRKQNTDQYFTAGLFSLLDAFFDSTLEEVLERLPISDELSNALLKYEGKVGMLLKFVIDYEQAKWEDLKDDYIDANNLTEVDIEEAYFESIAWASDISKSMFGSI